MARGLTSQASNAATTAGNVGAGYGNQAGGIAGTLIPTLTQEATNPTGYTPTQQNNQLVASEQGAGGATAGITGQAGLAAGRTRNSAATSGVLDQAARSKQQTLSQNALGIQNKSADLANMKQQEGIQGLQGLYGTDVTAQMKAMGLIPEDVNAAANASKEGWLQNTLATIGTLGGLGLGSAKAAGFG